MDSAVQNVIDQLKAKRAVIDGAIYEIELALQEHPQAPATPTVKASTIGKKRPAGAKHRRKPVFSDETKQSISKRMKLYWAAKRTAKKAAPAATKKSKTQAK
jgi:hypothetical protein